MNNIIPPRHALMYEIKDLKAAVVEEIRSTKIGGGFQINKIGPAYKLHEEVCLRGFGEGWLMHAHLAPLTEQTPVIQRKYLVTAHTYLTFWEQHAGLTPYTRMKPSLDYKNNRGEHYLEKCAEQLFEANKRVIRKHEPHLIEKGKFFDEEKFIYCHQRYAELPEYDKDIQRYFCQQMTERTINGALRHHR